MSRDITAKGGFMVSRRLIMAAAAAIVPFAAVNAVLISESAAVGPTAAPGSITCSYGTAASPVTLTFKPALTKSGTVVHATTQPSEVITVSKASLGGCTQTKSSTPPVTKGMATAAITVKIAGLKLGAEKWNVGACPAFQQMSWAKGMKPSSAGRGPRCRASSLSPKTSVGRGRARSGS